MVWVSIVVDLDEDPVPPWAQIARTGLFTMGKGNNIENRSPNFTIVCSNLSFYVVEEEDGRLMPTTTTEN